MWVFAFFDLPTNTKIDRKRYAQFRKALLKDGFSMIQYSVYARHCASRENADTHVKRMGLIVPPRGEVRFLTVTDRQYSMMETFIGKNREKPPDSPKQLELF